MQQIGKTTQQLKTAPQNSIFIVSHDAELYTKHLAHDLGRDDLKILPIESALGNNGERLRGLTTPVCVDHYAQSLLTENQWSVLRVHETRMVKSSYCPHCPGTWHF